MKPSRQMSVLLACLVSASFSVHADEVSVAVAANFTAPMKQIAAVSIVVCLLCLSCLSACRPSGGADGAVTVRCGETIVLVTAVSAAKPKEGQSFFPLTVEYREKAAAVGFDTAGVGPAQPASGGEFRRWLDSGRAAGMTIADRGPDAECGPPPGAERSGSPPLGPGVVESLRRAPGSKSQVSVPQVRVSFFSVVY